MIDVALTYEPFDTRLPSTFYFTINWSSPDWSLSSPAGVDPSQQPPLPGDDAYVMRMDPIMGIDSSNSGGFDLHYVIPNYNPEWISIDFRGVNVFIYGQILHECVVPAPGAILLASLGVGVVGYLRRRRAL